LRRAWRTTRGRARSHQQITQAGFECVGLPGPEADAETILLAHAACETAGLHNVRIDLSHVTIAQSLLDELPTALHAAVAGMLARKDTAALARLVAEAHMPSEFGERLSALVEHYGELDVLRAAAKSLRWPAAAAAVRNLREIVDRLDAAGLGDRMGVDLSDARGSSYYTGMSFNLLAEGPGEAIGAGGRYDRLLARYGMNLPATGFAFDLENLQWALRHAGHVVHDEPTDLRIVATVKSAREAGVLAEWVASLRANDIVVATLPETTSREACLAFARAWRYDAVLLPGASRNGAAQRGSASGQRPARAQLVRVTDGSERAVTYADIAGIDALQAWARNTHTKD
jgi:ATP phosphoribosyltransferase regulatory subunit